MHSVNIEKKYLGIKNSDILLVTWCMTHTGPVRFAEKTSWNTAPADLLWEKNNILIEKISRKVRIIIQANMAIESVEALIWRSSHLSPYNNNCALLSDSRYGCSRMQRNVAHMVET